MDDETKQSLMISFIGFNITVVVYMLYRVITREELWWTPDDPWYCPAVLGAVAVAAVLGLIVGAIVFAIVTKLNR
jgi:hypothetical protein